MEAYGQGAITGESQRISIERLVIGFNRRAVVENGLVKILMVSASSCSGSLSL